METVDRAGRAAGRRAPVNHPAGSCVSPAMTTSARSLRRALLVAAECVLLLFAAAACGSDDGDAGSADGTTTTAGDSTGDHYGSTDGDSQRIGRGGHDRGRGLLADRSHRRARRGDRAATTTVRRRTPPRPTTAPSISVRSPAARPPTRRRLRRARHLRVPLRDPRRHDGDAHRRGLVGSSLTQPLADEALRAVYAAHGPELYRFARRSLGRRRAGRGCGAGDVRAGVAGIGAPTTRPDPRSARGCSPSCATSSSTWRRARRVRPPLAGAAGDTDGAEQPTTTSTGCSPTWQVEAALAAAGRRPPARPRRGALARPALRRGGRRPRHPEPAP